MMNNIDQLEIQAFYSKLHSDEQLIAFHKSITDFDRDHLLRQSKLINALDQKVASENLNVIIETANAIGLDIIEIDFVPTSYKEACVCRYIFVPLLYKLGLNQKASDLGQMTFEFLYKPIHEEISELLRSFYEAHGLYHYQSIVNKFTITSPHIKEIKHRQKSINAIWHKCPNLKELSNFNKLHTNAPDLIGVRWITNIAQAENEYDALIHGLRLAPREHLTHFRNQMLPQKSGFDCEPVFKLKYVFHGFPIELQILADNIELYMSAKGYANYKAKVKFPPLRENLLNETWEDRLSICAFLSKNKYLHDFNILMYQELFSEPIDYEHDSSFILSNAPNSKDNQEYKIKGTDKPAFMIDNIELGFDYE